MFMKLEKLRKRREVLRSRYLSPPSVRVMLIPDNWLTLTKAHDEQAYGRNSCIHVTRPMHYRDASFPDFSEFPDFHKSKLSMKYI